MASTATSPARGEGSVNHLAWARMTAEFLPFFPSAIKPLIALGVDTQGSRASACTVCLFPPRDSGADVRVTLEAYAALPAEFIRANAGDQCAPSSHCIAGSEP